MRYIHECVSFLYFWGIKITKRMLHYFDPSVWYSSLDIRVCSFCVVNVIARIIQSNLLLGEGENCLIEYVAG